MRELRVDDSSNVRRLAWRPDSTLEVEFSSGAVYSYANVQLHQLADAAAAQSVGKWVAKTLVKDPVAYPVLKVRAADEAAQENAEKDLAAKLRASVSDAQAIETAQKVIKQMADALEAIADHEPKGAGVEAR